MINIILISSILLLQQPQIRLKSTEQIIAREKRKGFKEMACHRHQEGRKPTLWRKIDRVTYEFIIQIGETKYFRKGVSRTGSAAYNTALRGVKELEKISETILPEIDANKDQIITYGELTQYIENRRKETIK